MSALIDIFSSYSLTNAIIKLKTHEPFVLNTLFKTKQIHAVDMIQYEVRYGTDKIAQFVNSGEEALPVSKGEYSLKTVTLPRTYEKKVFTAFELAKYNVPGNLYISSSADKDRVANDMITDELEVLKQRAMRRREQLACEAIANGKIVVEQDNIRFQADFGFVTNKHLKTLTTTDKWNDAQSNPLENLLNWQIELARRVGDNADVLILGTDAASAFRKNEAVRKALDTSHMQVGDLDFRNKVSSAGVWIGKINNIDIFVYTQQYTAGSETKDMIPPKKAILVSSKNNGFRQHFGPIHRIENSKLKTYQTELLVETNTNLDKSALDWTVEQKTLPTIHEPDAIISVTVV